MLDNNIVDSLWEIQSQFCFSQGWVCLLKAALYKVVCKNKEEFYAILGNYEYPDVSDENIKDFCMEIVGFIENYGDENDYYLECFRQMLKTNAKDKCETRKVDICTRRRKRRIDK